MLTLFFLNPIVVIFVSEPECLLILKKERMQNKCNTLNAKEVGGVRFIEGNVIGWM